MWPNCNKKFQPRCSHFASYAAGYRPCRLVIKQLGYRRPARQPCSAASPAAEQDFTEPWSVYDNGLLYETAFPREYATQANFIEAVYSEFCGATPSAILELGCGPANHSVELAKRGYRTFALDINTEILKYARKKAEAEGVDIRFLTEDMQDFTLPEGAKVDIALLLYNSMAHLHSTHDARECLQCAYDALNTGGLLILELPSLHTIFDGSLVEGAYWEKPVQGQENVQLLMEYGTDDDEFDPESQVLRRRIGMSLRQGDDIVLVGEQYVWQRTWTYQEISLLAELSSFEVVATYGELDIDMPVDHPDAGSTVVCLQKPDSKDDMEFLNSL